MSHFVKTVCVTPLTSDGVIPTLMHSSYNSAQWYNGVSTGYFPRPLVVEVWECDDGEEPPPRQADWKILSRSELSACRVIDERGVHNEAAYKIKEAVAQLQLQPGQYLRLRRLTPEECYMLMGVSEDNINKLLSVSFRREPDMKRVSKKKSDMIHYGLAGNSIVVPVLKEVFRKMLFNRE